MENLTDHDRQLIKAAVAADVSHARRLLGCSPADASGEPSWDQINDAFHTLAHAVRRQSLLEGLTPCCGIQRLHEDRGCKS